MATNTLGGVNLTRISQLTLDSLKTMPIPLRAFTTDFSPDVAQSGNAVTTRFVTNPSATDFASSKATGNSTTTSRTITMNKYSGVSIGFTDEQMSYTDVKLAEMFIRPALVALFEDVMANVHARILAANFATNTVITAANFTAANVAGLNLTMNQNKVLMSPRSLIVAPDYANTLKKDAALQAAYAYGNNGVITTGQLPQVYGFTPYEFNGTIPNNSENLAGYALHPQALIIASRAPVVPQNWYGQVANITEPDSGLTVQFRNFYDGTEQVTQFCLLYGTGLGVTSNLIRIKSA
jgi:hypothetical protein